MRHFYAIFIVLFLIFPILLYSDEDGNIFLNINWQTSPEYVISILGLPDSISYDYGNDGKILNNINGIEYRIAVETVWTNPLINDGHTLHNENDIIDIINGHDKIWFYYDNIPYLNINSDIILTFNNRKYDDISFVINTENLTINEKNYISTKLKNYYFELYGSPSKLLQYNDNIFSVWYINNSMIMLNIFLYENDSSYSQYNYVDTISVYHSYSRN